MASSTIKQINQLARLLETQIARQTDTDELAKRIDNIEQLGGLVLGEQDALEQFRDKLSRTQQLFKKLGDAERLSDSAEIATNIRSTLTDPEWDDIKFYVKSLKELGQLLKEERSKAESRWETANERWLARSQQLEPVETNLTEAQLVGAAVFQEQDEVKQLRDVIGVALENIKDRNEKRLKESDDEWGSAQRNPDALNTSILDARETAKSIGQQTDLFLLQSPPIKEQYFDYTVLLRTLAAPGQRGTNVQDDRKVSIQNRDSFSTIIESTTDQITNGWRSTVRGGGQEPVKRHFVKKGDKRPSDKNIQELLRNVGDEIYRLVVPWTLQEFLVEREGTLTVTTNDLELPWELMAYPVPDDGEKHGVLCLDRPIGRIPIGTALPRRTVDELSAVDRKRKRRFAFFHANPLGDLPGAAEEVDKIIGQLNAKFADRLEIDRFADEEATGKKLKEILKDETYDVIHFAGHAGFDEEDAEMSSLLLHNKELFFAEDIRTLLKGQPFIFLNACQTGRADNENPVSIEYMQKPAAGLASSFIYGGALGCIGSLWPIYDDAAAKFAVDLYSHLLEGQPTGEAVRRARVQNYETHKQRVTWASYVLYGNPMLRLVS